MNLSGVSIDVLGTRYYDEITIVPLHHWQNIQHLDGVWYRCTSYPRLPALCLYNLNTKLQGFYDMNVVIQHKFEKYFLVYQCYLWWIEIRRDYCVFVYAVEILYKDNNTSNYCFPNVLVDIVYFWLSLFISRSALVIIACSISSWWIIGGFFTGCVW